MKKNKLHNDDSDFKIPDGYFEKFDEKLFQRLGIENDEVDLLNQDNATGFTVPDGYFDTIENTILSKIEKEATSKTKKEKVITLFSKQNILYVGGIAAMIAIIISVLLPKSNNLTIDAIDIADIQAYIEDGNIEFSNEEIASLIDDNLEYEDAFGNSSLSDEDVLEYLSEEELDDEMIFIE